MHPLATAHLSFLQAITLGLLQGVSELFPISSLGHSVLVPALIGGSWRQLVTQQSNAESPYLAFIVGLHVATAVALICFFWRDWVRIVSGFVTSVRYRRVNTIYERLAWLIVISTIPAGLLGLTFEHMLRTLFAKPEAAAIFITLNGIVLFGAEYLRRRASIPRVAEASTAPAEPDAKHQIDTKQETDAGHTKHDADVAVDVAITQRVSVRDAGIIGVFQSFALLAGISRSGITMVGGLLRGLDHEQAVRFSFLLATPVILAAGVVKVPDLFGHLGDGIRGQALAGSGAAFVAALISVRVLTRWFKTHTLAPFAGYCTIFGVFCMAYFR